MPKGGLKREFDADLVRTTLETTQGQVRKAAQLLGCGEPTLRRFLHLHPEIDAERRGYLRAPHPARHIFDPPETEMREIVLAKDGNYTIIGAYYNVNRRTIGDYMLRHPELADLATQVRETLVRPNMVEFEPDERVFAQQIKETNANLGALARYFGRNRTTILDYLDRHPELQQAVYDARETMLDMGEASLYRAVLNGEAWAVTFFLKTRGRMRGYVERIDTFSAKLDLNQLSIEQLQRLAAGEHPTIVLGTQSPELLTAGPRPYPAADAGAGDSGTEDQGS